MKSKKIKNWKVNADNRPLAVIDAEKLNQKRQEEKKKNNLTEEGNGVYVPLTEFTPLGNGTFLKTCRITGLKKIIQNGKEKKNIT